MLGKLSIPVKDVVRNGRLKDVFTLQVISHTIHHLTLTWSHLPA